MKTEELILAGVVGECIGGRGVTQSRLAAGRGLGAASPEINLENFFLLFNKRAYST